MSPPGFPHLHRRHARVTLTASGVANAVIGFSPQTIPDTGTRSTMTVQTNQDTPVRQFQITVTAAEEGLAVTEELVSLTVAPVSTVPDFSLHAQHRGDGIV